MEQRVDKKRRLEEMSGNPIEGRQPLTKRRQTSAFELIQFLSRAVEGSNPPKLKRSKKEVAFPKSKKHSLRVRQEFSESVQALVIFLRFGNLSDDSHEWLTPSEVFKRTGIKLPTQY